MKKSLILSLALTLSVGLWAEVFDDINYIDANGVEQTANNVAAITNASDTLAAGWYMVLGSDVQTSTLVCKGDVHLILVDGTKLTATGTANFYIDIYTPGIQVSGRGNTLTIYGQKNQSGQLIATGGTYASGIGGGQFQDGSNITINGGKITATGGYDGAGIGGGHNGTNITINGGTITAKGGENAAGIGGGVSGDGTHITINGGTITANGGEDGAGIGGGDCGYGTNITINGGEVTATGGDSGAGIGGGDLGLGTNITINGGEVTATGGDGASSIGGGAGDAPGWNIYISDAYVLKVGRTAMKMNVIPHSSLIDLRSILTQRYMKVEGLANPYTRTAMKEGQVGVVCLPYDATSFSGASFFQINYYEDDESNSGYKFYLEEVDQLVAGMPYILLATSENVVINHNGIATLTYGEEKKQCGLHGTFARKVIQPGGKLAALVEADVSWLRRDIEIDIPACRAYFDLSEIPEVEQPHSAPLRCVSVPGQNPMGLFNINVNANTNKFLYNGQLYIRKNGKTYTIMGVGK